MHDKQENDDHVAPHFTELFAHLPAVGSVGDYEAPALTAAVARGARDARAAGIPPERVLAHLRARLRDTPLAEIGDWYRGVLTDRLIARAIEAYFGEPDT